MTERLDTNINPGGAGDANVERLLAKAYRPEEGPDAAFRKQVEEAMYAEMNMPAMREWPRMRLFVTSFGAAAAAVLIVIGILQVVRNVGTGGGAAPSGGGRLDGQFAVAPAGPGIQRDFNLLTPRPREAAPRPEMAAAGDRIETKANEKRRVALADGSILYVNQKTTVKIEGPRRLGVSAGEIYVEVAPVPAGADPTFIVSTPGRRVEALGTKFDVRVGDEGTGVLVTQGKVKVSGVEKPVQSGQELAPEKSGAPSAISPAPRASHELEWTKELAAAAESPLVPSSEYEGGAIVTVDSRGQQARLSLRKYHVDVHIEDGFARTTIDQTYFNHENWRQEGTFYFPLPADASLSRLAMYVDGKLMEGGMAERDYARNVFEQIMYTRRDPALLEWMDGSTFKMRVFPLEPRQEKRIIISYVQKLPEAYAIAEYRFPAGHNLEVVRDWTFHATIKNGKDALWKSDTTPLTASVSGNDLVLDASANLVKIAGDVVVKIAQPQNRSLAEPARFGGMTHEGYRYLSMRYRPNLPGQPARQRRDWVFIFESSGNRDPLLARVQVDVIRTILENAEHDDTFAILTASTQAHLYAKEAQPATPQNVKSAIEFLDRAHLVGALDLGKALSAAEPFIKTAANPYLVHVGAGVASIGERREDVLAASIPANAHYIGIGVGKQWSRQLMKTAAARTGGYFTQINPDEQVGWRAFEVVSALNAPRLLDVKVADSAGKALFLTQTDSLVQGEELAAVARLEMGQEIPREVTITGTVDGKEFKQNVAVGNVEENAGYLPRWWAKMEIDRLLAKDAEANKAKIIDLSKAMYVMSPYTALLVLESEAMYEQFKVDRGRKDHWAMYPAPERIPVVYEPLPGWGQGIAMPMPIQPTPQPSEKMTAEQVLDTILVRIPVPMLMWPGDQNPYRGQTTTALKLLMGMPEEALTEGDVLRFPHAWTDFSDRLDVFWNESGQMNLWGLNGRAAGMTGGFGGSGPMNWEGGGGYRGGFGGGGFGPPAVSAPVSVSSVVPLVDAVPSKPSRAGAEPLDWRAGRIRTRQSMASRPEAVRLLEDESRVKYNALKLDRDALVDLLGDRKQLFPRGESLLRLRSSDEAKKEKRLRDNFRAIGPARGAHVNLLYQRPYFSGDWRMFSNLLQYAPGMNTSWADIQAVVEAEASDAPSTIGRIEPEARRLIDGARAIGWRSVKVTPDNHGEPFVVTFDGTGRYAYERIVSDGLKEQVICDGKTLWQLYVELGVGARRTFSRFHAAEFAAMVPWALPSADDLAHGCDVIVTAPRTVSLVPVAKPTTQPATQPAESVRIELVFDQEGRLVERRAVEMPSAKIVYRQRLDGDGLVTVFHADQEPVEQVAMDLRPAAEPNLTPQTLSLVVLPMPARTAQYVMQSRNLEPGKETERAADALALINSYLGTDAWGAMRTIGSRFIARGDKRIGMYTLLISSGQTWEISQHHNFGSDGARDVVLDARIGHARSALAQYLADQLKVNQQGYNAQISAPAKMDTFVERLGQLRWIYGQFVSGRANQGDEAQRQATRTKLVDFLKSCKDPYMAFGAMVLAITYGGTPELYQVMADLAPKLADVEGLEYVARYEEASARANMSGAASAREKFAKLYEETIEKGTLPLIDWQFRNAFQQGSNEEWIKLMHDGAAKLTKKFGRAAGVYVAWQVQQLGDQPLAEDLFSAAMQDVPKDQRFEVTMAAVQYLWNTRQLPRADEAMQPLLSDPVYGTYPEVWRIASAITSQRGMVARALGYLEKALDLEYKDLPQMIDVQRVRADYGQLLGLYQQLANALLTLETKPPENFIAKVIRYADRWRSLDMDDTAACQAAAKILQRFNATDLAWDYLTTPLAEHAGESAPWQALAQNLRQEGEVALADRAYTTAFELEPTNAQILWDRAQLLQQAQRTEEARQVYRQIAEGKWQPRFANLQQQARARVGQ